MPPLLGVAGGQLSPAPSADASTAAASASAPASDETRLASLLDALLALDSDEVDVAEPALDPLLVE